MLKTLVSLSIFHVVYDLFVNFFFLKNAIRIGKAAMPKKEEQKVVVVQLLPKQEHYSFSSYRQHGKGKDKC